MLNLIVLFAFSILNQKNSFRENLAQKIKIPCLRCNFVARLVFKYSEFLADVSSDFFWHLFSDYKLSFSILDQTYQYWPNLWAKLLF